MLTIQAHTMELAGTSYEIGYQLGSMTDAIPPLRQLHTAGFEGFGPEKVAEAREMFARCCPCLFIVGIIVAQRAFYGNALAL